MFQSSSKLDISLIYKQSKIQKLPSIYNNLIIPTLNTNIFVTSYQMYKQFSNIRYLSCGDHLHSQK